MNFIWNLSLVFVFSGFLRIEYGLSLDRSAINRRYLMIKLITHRCHVGWGHYWKFVDFLQKSIILKKTISWYVMTLRRTDRQTIEFHARLTDNWPRPEWAEKSAVDCSLHIGRWRRVIPFGTSLLHGRTKLDRGSLIETRICWQINFQRKYWFLLA